MLLRGAWIRRSPCVLKRHAGSDCERQQVQEKLQQLCRKIARGMVTRHMRRLARAMREACGPPKGSSLPPSGREQRSKPDVPEPERVGMPAMGARLVNAPTALPG